jgi:pyridoxal phosphate enzyme (YggS family)
MSIQPPDIADRYRSTVNQIKQCSQKYGRDPDSIRLVAVSKRHHAERVLAAAKLGQQEFGENYLQEGAEKIDQVTAALATSGQDNKLSWHFIGHIQSRKCRQIAEKFDWVHTVESTKVANRLDQFRAGADPLNVLIQLNLQQEQSKSGITLELLPQLANHLVTLPNLRFRGLMIIPEIENVFERQREIFRKCRETLEQLNQQGFNLDQLSMGMTADMEAAIAEGATQIRIGTAIFGPRPTQIQREQHEQ